MAIAAAVVGYFLILRGLTFAGHALSHIGFAGAAGAVLLGLDPLLGLLAFTVGAGLGIAVLGGQLRERDTAIGIVMTLALELASCSSRSTQATPNGRTVSCSGRSWALTRPTCG